MKIISPESGGLFLPGQGGQREATFGVVMREMNVKVARVGFRVSAWRVLNSGFFLFVCFLWLFCFALAPVTSVSTEPPDVYSGVGRSMDGRKYL